jgi:hypothetical protein
MYLRRLFVYTVAHNVIKYQKYMNEQCYRVYLRNTLLHILGNYHCSVSNFLEFVTFSIWLVLVISYYCFNLQNAEKSVFVFVTVNH